MSGQQLYERFVALMAERHDCGMDDWEQLDSNDRDVWNVLASEL